jgi:glycosyltransferase involved in cell wall biosynthesis
MEKLMQLPLVSVMMPSYNCSEYVVEAIESIIAQTYSKWELIFVDDGSTDDTPTIVKAYADNDKRIKYFRINHTGRGEARRRCIELSSGQYIAVCDSDDISMPERFEKQVQFLESHPAIGVVGAQIRSFSNLSDFNRSQIVNWPVTSDELARAFRKKRMKVPHPATMIRSSLFMTVGVYNRNLQRAQDYELFAKFSRAGVKFYNLPDMLLFYRQKDVLPSLEYFVENGLFLYFANICLDGSHLSLDVFKSTIRYHMYKQYLFFKYHTYVKFKYSILYKHRD